MTQTREKQTGVVTWHSELLGVTETGLSPLYCFYGDPKLTRFEDIMGKTGWIVGEYDSIPQVRGATPGGVVVYYDDGYLAVIDASRII